MAESFAGLAPLQDTPTARRTSGMTDEAASFLRLIADQQVPSRLGGWQATVQALTERAQASPYALEGIMSPQIQKMAQQLLQSNARLSRTFGPYSGAQLPYAMGQARAGLNLPGAYANTAIEAGQQLQDFLGKTSISVPQGQQFTETKQRPVDLAAIAQQVAGIAQAGASAYGGIRGLTAPSPTSGALPTTWDAYQKGGYANTTYAPFGQAPTTYGGGPGGMTFGNAGSYPYLYQ